MSDQLTNDDRKSSIEESINKEKQKFLLKLFTGSMARSMGKDTLFFERSKDGVLQLKTDISKDNEEINISVIDSTHTSWDTLYELFLEAGKDSDLFKTMDDIDKMIHILNR